MILFWLHKESHRYLCFSGNKDVNLSNTTRAIHYNIQQSIRIKDFVKVQIYFHSNTSKTWVFYRTLCQKLHLQEQFYNAEGGNLSIQSLVHECSQKLYLHQPNPNVLQQVKRLKKLWYIHAMEYYSAIKREEPLTMQQGLRKLLKVMN